MEERFKRGILPALIINLLSPGAGLLYLRRPVEAVICALVIMLVLCADKFLYIFAYFPGLALGVISVLAIILYTTLRVLFLVWKGVTVDQARRDMGFWIVLFMLFQGVSLSCLDTFPYVSYVAQQEVAPLEEGDWFLALRGNYDEARQALGRERLRPGTVVVVAEDGAHVLTQVWGFSGDLLEARQDELLRNGTPVARFPNLQLPNQGQYWLVPPKTVFVWRDESESNFIGSGSRSIYEVEAKALYIYWSEDGARRGLTLH